MDRRRKKYTYLYALSRATKWSCVAGSREVSGESHGAQLSGVLQAGTMKGVVWIDCRAMCCVRCLLKRTAAA